MKSFSKSILLLIHYWFPVVLGGSMTLVIQKATGLPISTSGVSFYLFAIWAAYSLDRLLEPLEERPAWLKASLLIGLLISAGLGSILVIKLSPQTISLILLFSIIVFIYHRAKKFPLFKTLLVAIVWTWAGVALPFENQKWFAWQFWTMQISLPLVILLATNAILCDFKDLKLDGLHGVHSLPVMLGLRNTTIVVSVLLVIAAVISYEQGRMGLVVSSAVLIGLAQFPLLLSLDAVGPLLLDAALALPGLLILLRWV
jgi:4-hydroxybenzoate polyprenyltransferase